MVCKQRNKTSDGLHVIYRYLLAVNQTIGSQLENLIYGNIGDRWNEDGVIASELVRDLSALQADTINLRINSYGGSVQALASPLGGARLVLRLPAAA